MRNLSVPQLSVEDVALLREAVARQQPDLLVLLDSLGRVPLTPEEQTGLRVAVTEELCATGLAGDDAPNERGLRLERLIDRLGHL